LGVTEISEGVGIPSVLILRTLWAGATGWLSEIPVPELEDGAIPWPFDNPEEEGLYRSDAVGIPSVLVFLDRAGIVEADDPEPE